MDRRGFPAMIPYYVHEGDMSRMERSNKRLWIAILLLVLCLVGTNVGWIIYESQFKDVVITQDNKEGINNFIGNDGDIYNREPEEYEVNDRR